MRILLALSLASILLLTPGCEARTQVAKEKALAKIDLLLGNMNVKRKEIELSVDALKDSLAGLRKALEGGDEGLARSVEQLEEKVSDLWAEVETELAVEDAKWDESPMDKFIVDLQRPKNTIEAIDKALAQEHRK